jgi:hypothetical protein
LRCDIIAGGSTQISPFLNTTGRFNIRDVSVKISLLLIRWSLYLSIGSLRLFTPVEHAFKEADEIEKCFKLNKSMETCLNFDIKVFL